MKRGLTVGLAGGGGTGPELAGVFSRAIDAMGRRYGVEPVILRDPRLYRTYRDVLPMNAARAARTAHEDARGYQSFLADVAAEGVRAVFRTAFNAQSVYLAREALRSVKVERLGDFLLVRDQAQGFYAGVNDSPSGSPDAIVRRCEFRRDTTWKVLDFALEEARGVWGARGPARIVLVYKFHLLDTRFAGWVSAYGRARGLRLELYQPDTMNRGLLKGDFKGRVLVVGSNEWLDIAHAELLARHGNLNHDERCVRNVYLDRRLVSLEEYQTVHGSADDLAGRGRVNPAATLRAAAAILERHAECSGAQARLERALPARRDGPTQRLVDSVLARFR